MGTGSRYDVITMGRVGVDLYPEQGGVPLSEVRTFAKSLGGSPTNVAVGAARYGHRTAVITKVGADGFGDYVRAALQGFGVDDRFVGSDTELHTPIVFCELLSPESPLILFYREPSAPDMQLSAGELDLNAIRDARIFWTTGTGLSAEPSRTATLAALEARGRAAITVHDLDYRSMFWASPDDARAQQLEALALATVAVGNIEECAVVVGDGPPEDLARRLLDLGLDLAIVKLGGDGVLAAWEGEVERVPPVLVRVVNGLGAGDAFGAGVCHGLLEGWDVPRTIRFASAAGAHVAARLACADEMPDEAQVEALLVDV
ncbi:MAG: 5-dehydro-2-deoxygluconokinase [Actinomycetota bacterium]